MRLSRCWFPNSPTIQLSHGCQSCHAGGVHDQMQSGREICRQIDAVSRTDGYYVTLSRYVRCIDISTRVNGLLSTGCPASLRRLILHHTAQLVESCYNAIVDSNVAFGFVLFLACLYEPTAYAQLPSTKRQTEGNRY